MPRIVVLDGLTTTAHRPGDAAEAGEPSWDHLAAIGTLEVYDRSGAEQVVQRVGEAPIVLTNKTQLTADLMRQLPMLRYVGLLSTGTNAVDLQAAAAAGVTVCNVPAYSTASVAQHVFALLLHMANAVGPHDKAVREGRWVSSPDFCFTVQALVELEGRSLGIVGLGDIGRRTAAIGSALGMRLLAHSRSRRDVGLPVKWCDLDELFEQADVVSLHCPLTDQTRHMVNAERLARMKPTAYLINTGRGPLVDEAALAAALHAGQIAGAGLDVLSVEPPAADNPLLRAPRCVITPHLAWATQAARRRLMDVATQNVEAFLAGQPQNVVAGPGR